MKSQHDSKLKDIKWYNTMILPDTGYLWFCYREPATFDNVENRNTSNILGYGYRHTANTFTVNIQEKQTRAEF